MLNLADSAGNELHVCEAFVRAAVTVTKDIEREPARSAGGITVSPCLNAFPCLNAYVHPLAR